METSCELTGRERKGTLHKAYVWPPNNWELAAFFTVYFLGVAGGSGKKLGGAKLKPRQDKNGCWDEQVSRLPLAVWWPQEVFDLLLGTQFPLLQSADPVIPSPPPNRAVGKWSLWWM